MQCWGVLPTLGVPLIGGGTVRLPRIVGQGSHWIWCSPDGSRSRGGIADRTGHRGGAAGEVAERSQALAERIAAHPQACLRRDGLGPAGWYRPDDL